MKSEELILEIQEITLDVKNNLDCCYAILEYLEPKRNDETWKVLSMIHPHFGYLYYLLRNHLQISILLLNSLLCPVG
jgi:hypothetical protein